VIGLLRAEFTRLFSRRLAILSAILVVVAVLAFQLVVNSELTPPTAAEVAAAQSQFEQSHREWEQTDTACRDQGQPPQECSYPEPRREEFEFRTPFDVITGISVRVAVYLGAFALFLVAASFIGAEYTSGSISNWLTFVPQRGRVFAAKLITVVGFAAVLSLVVSGLALLLPVILVQAHGGTAIGLSKLVGVGLRGVVIAVVLAAVGFCIGLVSRHTAAAIGVLLGYLFLYFVRAVLLGSSRRAQELTPWTPEGNFAAIVGKSYAYEVPIQQVTSDGVDFSYVEHTISLSHGLIYWAVVLAVVVAVSAVIFQRRDVT
jgi:ABC-2 type transport system permease protein